MTPGRVLVGVKPSAIVPRVLAVLLAVAACLVAWRFGGGAESSAPRPRSSTSGAGGAPGAPVEPGHGYEVSVRLVEIADKARFDMPRAEARPITKAHWRWQKPPFLPITGDAARFVTSIALGTSASETRGAMPVGEGRREVNEGSFDQREALVSPAPGTITFRVTVPHGGKLTFAEGTVDATEVATAFVVSVLDVKGTLHDVHRHVLEPTASRTWTEASCDLSAFAGQEVELRLATEIAKAAPVSEPRRGRSREPAAPVALWGNPTILAKTTPRVPYNVLWIVVDALRSDVIATFRDDAEDAAKRAAPLPPLEALLPKVPGLTPEIDDLTKRGVRFTHAYSAGAWTRPGTLAMLAGARSSELGIDATDWIVTPAQAARFYGSDPPLLSLALRRQNVTTRAFVNNHFMVGHEPAGIDMGFERVDDHRHRTRDTFEITKDATQWIRDNKDTRFFAFVNYKSPHEAYEPPAQHLEKVPPPPAGPKDETARLYMAEAAKDDEAIGVLMRTLDETGLRDRTIVVVTAAHGETMSSAHAVRSGLDKMPIRDHHAASNFEETTKIPIVIVAPGLLPSNAEVKARVRSIDIAPTLLDLLGLEPHARVSGKSLVPLAKGQAEPEERVVVSEGRGSRAIMHGAWRMILREGAAKTIVSGDRTREAEVELFDLAEDPGERRDLSTERPEVVAEMKARLEAALKNVPVAGASRTSAAPGAAVTAEPDEPPTLRLRFVGGGSSRRVSGSIFVGNERTRARSFDVSPVELGRDAFHVDGGKVDVALRTSPSEAVGFDIVVDPPGAPITWELWLDDRPWPDDAVFGGPFGLPSPVLKRGVATDDARGAARSTALPTLDPRRDLGLFVTRERRAGDADVKREASDEGAEEMARLLLEWGYAHGSSATTR